MKYRILKDGELYYPQKRWYFIWVYFKDGYNKPASFTNADRAQLAIDSDVWVNSLGKDVL